MVQLEINGITKTLLRY